MKVRNGDKNIQKSVGWAHWGTVKFVLKFGKAEMAEMAVRGSRYSAPRNSLGAVVANLVTVRGWF